MTPAANPTPRAIRHFGLAALQVRARRTRQVMDPARGAPPPRAVRLRLPMTPVFLLLAPFAIVAIPLLCLVPPLRRLNFAAAAFAVGGVLLALGGTDIDIQTPRNVVRLKIL